MAKGLSVVIITRNEEQNIGRCLDSVKGLADEIVVVDSGSTDATEDICISHGARFEFREWQGYAAQKNIANDFASNDYILSLDADEALSPRLKESIFSEKQRGFEGAYLVNRLPNYCGSWIRHCGWHPDWKLRLWHRKEGKWEGSIHEQVSLPPSTTQKRLQGKLFHYTYHSLEEHVAQANAFTTLTAREAYERGKRSSLLKILVNPAAKFFSNYFLKLGFLDGYAGFTVCRMNAFATYLKYSKLRELHRAERGKRST